MGDFSWIKKLENPDRFLSGDMRIIADSCGMDVFITLFEEFRKSRIHFSEAALAPMKIEYIKKHYNGKNARELSKILDVGIEYIYKKSKCD